MKAQQLRDDARRFFVHKPDDLTQSYVDWAERLQTEPGITYGCVLDKALIPLHPGDLMGVVARPGHGKSSFMAYMARREALSIVARGQADSEAAVYVTWEQTAEEIEAFFQAGDSYSSTDMAWGRVPINKIRQQAVSRVQLPVWVIGESKRHEGRVRPRMKVEYVYAAVESMRQDYGVRPTLLCLDYVQIIPVDNAREKIEQVENAIQQAKQLAIRTGIPVIVGVQAGRKVDDYRHPIPTMADAQWSSSIEQVADKLLALWRPIRTFVPDDKPTINIKGVEYTNDEELFVVRILKQRFGVGFGSFAIRFLPQTLAVHDYDTKGRW